MFEGLENTGRTREEGGAVPPAPPVRPVGAEFKLPEPSSGNAPEPGKQAEFESRMESLHNKGRKRGRRFSVVGIGASVLIAGTVIAIGYYIGNQVKELTGELDRASEVNLEAAIDPGNLCAGDPCCLSSLRRIKRAASVRPGPEGQCPSGYEPKKLDCEGSLSWCELAEDLKEAARPGVAVAGYLWHEDEGLGCRFLYPLDWRLSEQDQSLTITNNEADGVIIQAMPAGAYRAPEGFELVSATTTIAGGRELAIEEYAGILEYNRDSRHWRYLWPQGPLSVSADFETVSQATAEAAMEKLAGSLEFTAAPEPPSDGADGAEDAGAAAEQGLPEDDVVKDSDNDGLTDQEEVGIYGTDPMNPDTDGDGYSDGNEVKNGYNPKGEGRLEIIDKTNE